MAKTGHDYLSTAARFAEEASAGTSANSCTSDGVTESVNALVYFVDPEGEEMKLAYPNMLLSRTITDGRAMMRS
eukprot:9490777-Alexandrium_andersonii.AAC.1